jgi:hypothetical protein
MELTPTQIKFHLAEYSTLKAEAGRASAAAAAHLRWAAVSSAGILAWLSTQGADLDIPLAVFLSPAAICLLMGCLASMLHFRAAGIREYLLKIEAALGRKPELGWEEVFMRQKIRTRVFYTIAWIALFGADVYAGLAIQAYAMGDQATEMRQATTT